MNKIIVEGKEKYHQEKQEILRVGLLVSEYINTDDTGARHQGVNSYCTQIGNEWFASLGRHSLASYADAGSDRWFETTPKKNRINFLESLSRRQNRVFKDKEEWDSYLNNIGIVKSSHLKTATEGALIGAIINNIINNGISPKLGIISDGAGQFRLLEHGL